jgi:demethylmenaquinone methyltransferase/2-methoxy-6-polyprenyl-1,4-benzoquinol methylase
MPEASSTGIDHGARALAPHAPLTAYYADEQERQGFLRRIFDDTAEDYDRIERLLAFGSGPWYRRQALQRAGLRAGDAVLDVGIGTGLVAREALKLVGPAGSLAGVDPSAGMMQQSNLPGIALIEGRAESLPRPDASCDFVSMGYALRHIADVRAAFSEFHRVLRPGGRLLVLEITKPPGRWGTALLKGYMRGVVPLLARAVARRHDTAQLWRYYWDTIEACIPPADVMAALAEAGFASVNRHVELGLFSEYTAVKSA